MPPPPHRSARGSAPVRPAATPTALTELDAVVLVKGPEEVLADRAVARVLELARERDPAVEVTQIDAAAYGPGQLELAASPSLFGEERCLIVLGVEAAGDAFLADALAYLERPAPEATLVLRHAGGQRGKRLLDAVTASFTVVACEPIRRDAEKLAFVQDEFRRAGRRADQAAVRALVDALGNDLLELVAACQQLVADTSGTVTEAVVHRYHGGRVEATGFAVADAALAGDGAEAIRLLRHALSTGLDPVPLVATLAVKLRTLAKVGATRGQGAAAVRDLGLAPWQVDKARRELGQWTPEGLAAAITAVAAADAEVKGAARDPGYAVERAVLRIAAAHGRRATA
jgi:DNA polymerase-3 subunit delta